MGPFSPFALVVVHHVSLSPPNSCQLQRSEDGGLVLEPGDHPQRGHGLQRSELHRPRGEHGRGGGAHQSEREPGEAVRAAPGPKFRLLGLRCSLAFSTFIRGASLQNQPNKSQSNTTEALFAEVRDTYSP